MSDPIRRAWAAWEQHERRTAVQLRIPELHLTDEDEPASLQEHREAVELREQSGQLSCLGGKQQ